LIDKTGQTLTLHRYGTDKQCADTNDLTQPPASAQVHRGLEINSSGDDIILILTVGYVCYITISGGSSQHSVVVLFDLYVAASERSHLDAV